MAPGVQPPAGKIELNARGDAHGAGRRRLELQGERGAVEGTRFLVEHKQPVDIQCATAPTPPPVHLKPDGGRERFAPACFQVHQREDQRQRCAVVERDRQGKFGIRAAPFLGRQVDFDPRGERVRRRGFLRVHGARQQRGEQQADRWHTGRHARSIRACAAEKSGRLGKRPPPGQAALTFAALASPTIEAKPSGSWIAISESILRLSRMPAFVSPSIRRL